MKIIASGTFDRLHKGHEFFLENAFKHGFVLIALTSDEMVKRKKLSHLIEPYHERKKKLIKYLRSKGYKLNKDYKILKIHDRWGFAIDVEDIDAILVSKETRRGAEEINKIREKKGWKPLKIFEIPLLSNNRGKISSTRLRLQDSIQNKGNT